MQPDIPIPPGKRDLVFLAEGYTADEQEKFVADAKRFTEALMKPRLMTLISRWEDRRKRERDAVWKNRRQMYPGQYIQEYCC